MSNKGDDLDKLEMKLDNLKKIMNHKLGEMTFLDLHLPKTKELMVLIILNISLSVTFLVWDLWG